MKNFNEIYKTNNNDKVFENIYGKINESMTAALLLSGGVLAASNFANQIRRNNNARRTSAMPTETDNLQTLQAKLQTWQSQNPRKPAPWSLQHAISVLSGQGSPASPQAPMTEKLSNVQQYFRLKEFLNIGSREIADNPQAVSAAKPQDFVIDKNTRKRNRLSAGDIAYARSFLQSGSPQQAAATCQQAEVQQASIEDVARQVMAGQFGNGPARVQALQAAGHNPQAVQAKVNELVRAQQQTQQNIQQIVTTAPQVAPIIQACTQAAQTAQTQDPENAEVYKDAAGAIADVQSGIQQLQSETQQPPAAETEEIDETEIEEAIELIGAAAQAARARGNEQLAQQLSAEQQRLEQEFDAAWEAYRTARGELEAAQGEVDALQDANDPAIETVRKALEDAKRLTTGGLEKEIEHLKPRFPELGVTNMTASNKGINHVKVTFRDGRTVDIDRRGNVGGTTVAAGTFGDAQLARDAAAAGVDSARATRDEATGALTNFHQGHHADEARRAELDRERAELDNNPTSLAGRREPDPDEGRHPPRASESMFNNIYNRARKRI